MDGGVAGVDVDQPRIRRRSVSRSAAPWSSASCRLLETAELRQQAQGKYWRMQDGAGHAASAVASGQPRGEWTEWS